MQDTFRYTVLSVHANTSWKWALAIKESASQEFKQLTRLSGPPLKPRFICLTSKTLLWHPHPCGPDPVSSVCCYLFLKLISNQKPCDPLWLETRQCLEMWTKFCKLSSFLLSICSLSDSVPRTEDTKMNRTNAYPTIWVGG